MLIGLPTALLSFSSCDKNDDPPKTKTQLLTQSTWKFKTATANGTDVSSSLQTCQKDNLLTFSSGGNGNVNEGPSKCNGADPDNIPFTWAFASGETLINVSNPLFTNGATSLTLLSLTETELVVEMLYNPPIGPAITMVITFIH